MSDHRQKIMQIGNLLNKAQSLGKQLMGGNSTDQTPASAPRQDQQPTRRRRTSTQNQADFNACRAATLEICHPSKPEPWIHTRPQDLMSEEYRRRIDEDLPIITIPEAMDKGMKVRLYFNSTAETYLLDNKVIYRVAFEKNNQGFTINTTYEECGTYILKALTDNTNIALPNVHGGEELVAANVFVTPRGEGFASPQFTHSLILNITGAKSKIEGEVVDVVDLELPIYNALAFRIKRDRQQFLARLSKRDSLSLDWARQNNVRPPFTSTHEGYLMRWPALSNVDLSQARFTIRSVGKVEQAPAADAAGA